jgi:hypothetical protein
MTSALSGDITAVVQSSGDAGDILKGNYYITLVPFGSNQDNYEQIPAKITSYNVTPDFSIAGIYTLNAIYIMFGRVPSILKIKNGGGSLRIALKLILPDSAAHLLFSYHGKTRRRYRNHYIPK